jgi:alpha-1,2-mannosyltransferase
MGTRVANESRSKTPALFDETRMLRYPLLVVAIFLLSAIVLVTTSHDMIDLRGKPLGYDFITFWGASDLTLQGKAEAAFDAAQSLEAQQTAVPQTDVAFYWHYPPTFQLIATPLALLPYALSYLVFVSLGMAAYLAALRPLLDQPRPLLLLAAFPATLLCVYHGQNALLSAALFGAAAYFSDRGARGALVAGACIGLLAYKPQLGLLAPFALAAAGQWRIFAAAAATTVVFAGLATLAFGPALWLAFLDNLPFVRTLVESGALPWAKMPSAFIFMRYVGAPEILAYAVQAAAAFTALGVVVYVWRRCGMTPLSWAVLVAATLMVPHYIFDYELALLAVPLAIVMSDMAKRGATRTEKIVLLITIAIAGATAPIASAIHIQIGFPVLVGALWLSTRRALLNAGPAAHAFPTWRKRQRPA